MQYLSQLSHIIVQKIVHEKACTARMILKVTEGHICELWLTWMTSTIEHDLDFVNMC